MGDLENELKALEQALRRKKQLKSLIEILFEEYGLIRAEIEIHKERMEKLMSAKEYSAYLDTIDLGSSFEFPAFADQKPTAKKK
jgi:hypothetical protein